VDTKKDLHKEVADIKKGLREELNLRIHGTQVEIETRRMRVETTWYEFKLQLAEVKTRAEHRSYGRTGTGVGAMQPPKFYRSISWAVLG
jgi:hypothetical protein